MLHSTKHHIKVIVIALLDRFEYNSVGSSMVFNLKVSLSLADKIYVLILSQNI